MPDVNLSSHKVFQARPGIRDAFRLRIDKSQPRVGVLCIVFLGLFGLIAGRLVWLGLHPDRDAEQRRRATMALRMPRPDIRDRNGQLLATSVKSVSVFAEPRNIIDPDEASELLSAVLPNVNARELRSTLSSGKGFAWVARHITPRQQAEVHRLGIPGIGFWPEPKRVYPNGRAAAHILGATNLDGEGIAGIEKYIDDQGIGDLAKAGFDVRTDDLKPLTLSLDLRIQHALRDELDKSLTRYKAKAAAGMMYDVETGEVVALASLPDFDPQDPADALDPDHINRINVGVFEMGSTFKAVTTAMALDSGKVGINSTFDTAGGVLRSGRQVIHEFHGTGRALTVPEVFLHSSNIGSAKMALAVGIPGHQAFLRKMGLLDRLRTELPESAAPLLPSRWSEISTITISYGHGIAVAPLQAVMAVGALVNGGKLIKPTFLRRTASEAARQAVQVVKPETSEALRYVMRLNALKGSAWKAAVAGFYVGGKTGTAEKVVRGRYDKTRLFTTFMAIAPADKPRYLFLTVMDEPKGIPETYGLATAAWNSGETTGNIIERVGPLLMAPRFAPPLNPFPTMSRLNAWGINEIRHP